MGDKKYFSLFIHITMCTLLEKYKADSADRRSVLMAMELARYNIDIAAFSERHFADKDQMTETETETATYSSALS